jgi:type II restriction enzyme
MAINIDKRDSWKSDIARSVDMYNEWFLRFAPQAFRKTRITTTKEVEETLKATSNLTFLSATLLTSHPETLPTLRMCACPPLAVDRLVGLSGVSKNLVASLEGHKRIPPHMLRNELTVQLSKLMGTLSRLADPDIFPWLDENRKPDPEEVRRAATIVADRLCGAYANPIIRNAQEARQLYCPPLS